MAMADAMTIDAKRLAKIRAGCDHGYPLSFDVGLTLCSEVERLRAERDSGAYLEGVRTILGARDGEGLDERARSLVAELNEGEKRGRRYADQAVEFQRERAEKAERLMRTCISCKAESPDVEALRAHIEACEAHPMAALRRDRDEARAAACALREALKGLLRSVGEYARQSMAGNPEMVAGLRGAEAALATPTPPCPHEADAKRLATILGDLRELIAE